MSLKDKKAIAKKLIDSFNKKSAEGATIGFASDITEPIQFIPTPSEELNRMLGGGVPKGRITEVFGSNSSGKTSIMLETIGEEMERDPDSIWAWFESEESFDPEYAVGVHGIDLERLIYIDVTDLGAEASLDKLETFIRSGILTGFVVNSVAGLSPKAEMEEEIGKQSIALQARMMSKLMRKWNALIGKKKVAAVFINQQRTDVGARFGDPNVTTGGRALSYYASTRFGMNSLKVQESDPISANDGLKLSARVAKNRCVYDNPYKKCEFYVLYGIGVDKLTEVMADAPEAGILRVSGSWFYYEDESGDLIEAGTAIVDGKEVKNHPLKFQGKTKLREFLNENPWFLQQLKQELAGAAKRGALTPKFQTEEEMKEIEELQKVEAQIEKELEESAKAEHKAKATPKKKSTTKKKVEE